MKQILKKNMEEDASRFSFELGKKRDFQGLVTFDVKVNRNNI
jgi:hypothetical protein